MTSCYAGESVFCSPHGIQRPSLPASSTATNGSLPRRPPADLTTAEQFLSQSILRQLHQACPAFGRDPTPFSGPCIGCLDQLPLVLEPHMQPRLRVHSTHGTAMVA